MVSQAQTGAVKKASHALLPEWANNQDGWVRSIATDILKNRVQSSDSDIDRYLKLLIVEKKLSDDPFETIPEIEEKQLDAAPLDAVSLDRLTIGDGVNALKHGATIEFAKGVTVVFGENGSGKSGYVRILKRAAGVRTAEDILHNIHSDKRPIPSATFAVTVGDQNLEVAWKNEFGVTPLSRISVFDARGARLHVEDDLNYVYTPGDLTLFPLVQNAIERVRVALEAAIRKGIPGPNTLLRQFDRACSIYATIETLGAATDLGEIRRYAAIPDDVDATIETLKVEVDALKSTNIQAELERAHSRASLVRSLHTALLAVQAFDVDTYRSHVQARDRAARRHADAGAAAFQGLDIPRVFEVEWRRFIQSGEDYIRSGLEEPYPHEGTPCAYCRQPLTATAVDLVRKYRDFVSDHIKSAADEAEEALGDYVRPLLDLDVNALLLEMGEENNDQADVLDPLVPLLEQTRAIAANVVSGAEVAWPGREKALVSAEDILTGEATRLNDLIGHLQTSAAERLEALKAKQQDLTELLGSKTAHILLPQIEQRVADAKWVAKAGIVKNNMTPLLRSLTEAAKDASSELLNRGFGERFEAECHRLRVPNVTLNFPGRQGQVTRRKLVASYKPEQILSEGEQKALALADFLAEVTAVPASSPVVFDDPITSMDYRRIHEVCDRVVELSKEHQVIVCTHNIWFAAELLSKADKKNWKYYDIRYEGSESGVLTAATHPRVDTVAQVKGTISKLIDTAENQDGELRLALVEKGYEYLRTSPRSSSNTKCSRASCSVMRQM